ncbi:polyamine aminopropyltransferase [Chitinispirillales bacterium ANBcel5]|uniref:polyamine aminopropyltransferase n=1 Tax=Cellulosispirillum alkaliphilum TaxID=3039283 RepID=UPI002A51BFA2|nr:polyamine aminopropyltransferase [Chitinispirillales bacterium ANBcel5]
MNSKIQCSEVNETSIWIENLVNGRSGLTIKARQSVFCGSSPFQKIEVYDTYRFGLVLCLGGSIVLTEKGSEPYNEMMVHPAMIMHKNPQTVCIIGGGDGGCLKEVLKYQCVERVVVVEIDGLVKETIENYFSQFKPGFKDPRTEVIIDDGYQYLKNSSNTFDLILVDSYDPGGPVRSLESADFYSLVANRLNSEGLAVFQTDSPILREEFLRRAIMNVSSLFAQYKSYISFMRTFPEGICSFLVASIQKDGLDTFSHKRYEQIGDSLRYYNDEIHRGAFLLPQNIRTILRP